MTPSPRRNQSQKGKTQYVDNNDDDDFDNDYFDDNNEENCMEDLNSFMKNATISGGMRTVTLHKWPILCLTRSEDIGYYISYV